MRTFVLILSIVQLCWGIELTFEMPDNTAHCFYEDMKAGLDGMVEFQVVTGGQYDIDVTIEGPDGKEIYKEVRKQYDTVSWKAAMDGTYKTCFSNEFSSFSHKVVYFEWQLGDGRPKEIDTPGHHAAMGLLDNSAIAIGDKLRVVDDYQTHHRLREATGRKRAEQLNERVLLWSLGQTAVVILIGVAQVLLLRSFFSDKRSRY